VAGASDQWPLVGRGEELAMLDEQVGVTGGCMVLAGAVGVGKSRLLTGWAAELEAQGRPVVVVRATRSTATIPFGAFAGWIPAQLGDTRDRLGVLRATAARLAQLGPRIVVAVDDAQLLDDGSAALVLHLTDHGLAGVLVAVRSGEPCPDAVVSLWKERRAVRLDLQPLAKPEMVDVLGQVLGGDLTTAANRRLWDLTRGNPLYLREVVDAARAQGVLAPSPAGWQWHGALRGRGRLVELVSDRITTSDAPERRALEIVALGEPLPAEVLARVVSPDVLARLERRGLVVGEHSTVRLVHPLYSEVLRAELAPFTAQSHRRVLAEAAVAAGADQREPLRVATWMLDSDREADEPELLLRASFLAQVVADHELCIRLTTAAERAGAGWRATLRRAESLGALRRWDDAAALLGPLSDPASEPEAQAAAVGLRADLSYWYRGEDPSVATAILDAAAVHLAPPARATVLNQRAAMAIVGFELEEAIRLATAACADAATVVDRLAGLGCAAFAAVLLGRTRAARATVEQAAPYAFEVVDAHPTAGTYLAAAYSHVLVLGGRIDDAAAVFELLLDHEVAQMGGMARALPALLLARARLAQGRVATAADLGHDALALLGDNNHYDIGTWAANTVSRAAAQAGDTLAAREAIDWIDTHARTRGEPESSWCELARAWTHAAEGELSTACRLAAGVAERARAAGAWAVELLALLDVTRFGAARAAAPRLTALADLVEGRFAGVVARFAEAAACHDGTALDDAAQRFATMGAHLLAAEAATLAASAHTRAGQRRAAVASVAAARSLTGGCEGATTPLLARLDDAPPAEVLTPREREVAELAARGRTSRDIAEALTISVRTVDSHLNHAYTKLGITNRHDLPATLGRRPSYGATTR
jgi:DNA-binding CsgD family transcriptional regulator